MKLLILSCLSFLIIAGLFSRSAGAEKSPSPCTYQHNVQTYLCTKVKDVFPHIFYGNYHLKCDGCNLPVWSKDAFPYENSLISMNLTKSGIKLISANAFETLSTLQFIYLQHNNIKNISENAFYALRQVYELHLEYNELAELTPRFLNGFEANGVIISNNKLSELLPNVFEGIFGVMMLDLSHNTIYKLHIDSFNHLKGLEYLDLQHNHLCSIPLGTFRHLRILKELNLAHNKFKRFNHGMFTGLSSLVALNLSHNDLGDFEASSLIPLMKLTRLDVSANGLHYLDSVPIHNNAPGLRQVGISDNLWSCDNLVYLVQYLKTVDIDVIDHDKYDVTNIKGIACVERHVTYEKIPFKNFYKISKDLTEARSDLC